MGLLHTNDGITESDNVSARADVLSNDSDSETMERSGRNQSGTAAAADSASGRTGELALGMGTGN